MKKIYTNPKTEILKLSASDIISTSGEGAGLFCAWNEMSSVGDVSNSN